MPRLVIPSLLAVAAIAVAVLWGAGVFRSDADVSDPGERHAQMTSVPAESASPPGLQGRPETPDDDMAPALEGLFEAFLRLADEDDATAQADALAVFQSLEDRDAVPLDRLIRGVLEGKVPLARSLGRARGLGGHVRGFIGMRATKAREFIPEILAKAMVASKEQQGSLAKLLKLLRHVRIEDLPQVKQVLEREATGLPLQAALIEGLEVHGVEASGLADVLLGASIRISRNVDPETRFLLLSPTKVQVMIARVWSGMGEAGAIALADRVRAVWATRPDPADADRSGHLLIELLTALTRVDPQGHVALAELGRQAPDAHRDAVLSALADIRHASPPVRAFFVEMASSKRTSDREFAARGLRHHGPSGRKPLIGLAQDPETTVRVAALQSLSEMKGDVRELVGPLSEMLATAPAEAMPPIVKALARLKKVSVPALPGLLALLDRTGPGDLEDVLPSIAAVAAFDQETLAARFEGAPADRLRSLLRIVDCLGEPSTGVLHRVDRACNHKQLDVRVLAASVSIRRGRKTPLYPLIQGFEAEDGRIRTQAVTALARGGAAAADLLPVMLERLERTDAYEDDRVGSEHVALAVAVQALGRHDLDAVLPSLGSAHRRVRLAAELAFEAADRVQARGLLLEAWSTLDSGGQAFALAISKPWRTYGEEDQEDSGRALRRLGLQSRVDEVLCAAIRVSGHDASLSKPFRAAVLRALRSKVPETTGCGATALIRMGTEAAPLEKELRALADHPIDGTRSAVKRALSVIEDARKR